MSYRGLTDVETTSCVTFIFSYKYFSSFLSSITDLLGGQKIGFFSVALYVTEPNLYTGAWVRFFRAHLLSISNKNIFFKIQGIRLGEIVTPNKDLE